MTQYYGNLNFSRQIPKTFQLRTNQRGTRDPLVLKDLLLGYIQPFSGGERT